MPTRLTSPPPQKTAGPLAYCGRRDHLAHAAVAASSLSGSRPPWKTRPWTVNPVVQDAAPDPGCFVVDRDERVVVVTTGGSVGEGAFPLRQSWDGGVSWELMGHALPAVPKWWAKDALLVAELAVRGPSSSPERWPSNATLTARDVPSGDRHAPLPRLRKSHDDFVPSWSRGKFWAPEIHKIAGRFVLYYTATDQSDRLVIGAATSTSPLGPYDDPVGRPLVSNAARASFGVIDPTAFVASDGTPYLIWKDDGNARDKPTPIWLQELAPDGLSLKGERVELIRNAPDSWEGGVVEGPWMIKEGAYHYLFYSGNSYAGDKYALGVARSTALKGPYEKADGPVMKTASSRLSPFAGPGHNCVLKNGRGEYYTLYHAWVRNQTGSIVPTRGRVMLRDRVRFSAAGWPVVGRYAEPSYDERSRTYHAGPSIIRVHGDPMFQADGRGAHFWIQSGRLTPLLQWAAPEGNFSLLGKTFERPNTGNQWFDQVVLATGTGAAVVDVSPRPTASFGTIEVRVDGRLLGEAPAEGAILAAGQGARVAASVLPRRLGVGGDRARGLAVEAGGVQLSVHASHSEKAAAADEMHLNLRFDAEIPAGATGLFAELAGVQPMTSATEAMLKAGGDPALRHRPQRPSPPRRRGDAAAANVIQP